MRRGLFVLGTVLLTVVASGRSARADQTVVRGVEGEKLDAYLGRLAAFGFSGVVLVAKDGEPILEKGYGLADREKKRSFTPDTVVSLGSITKQFTAAAILKLEMQGKLRVSDPIAKYFQNVPADKNGITLHHLLTHSAGLESDFGEGDFEPVSRAEIIKRALASKLRSEPGKRYHYSNAGFSLLAAIVELVSGQGYEAYLNENVFKPAGLTKTGYRFPQWKPEEVAQGYLRDRRHGTILEKRWAADGPYWNLRGNGGIHTTVGDMLKWHLALEGDAVLSNDARTKLQTPYIREGVMPTYYGYGWVVGKTKRGTRLIEHNGGDGIFTADCKRYLDDRTFDFAASNNSQTPAWMLTQWIDALLFGGEYPQLPEVVTSASLENYAGTYQLPSGGKLIVRAHENRLVLGGEGQDALTLLASGKTDTEESMKALSTRTAAIFEANAKGDFAPLQKALGNGAPLERVTKNQSRLRRELEAEHGAYQGFEVLGTVRAGQLRDTYVRLKFSKGSVLMRYGWADGHIALIGPVQALPAAQAFQPLSAGEFASFNFMNGRLTRVRFHVDATGKITGLTLASKTGDIVASRASAKRVCRPKTGATKAQTKRAKTN